MKKSKKIVATFFILIAVIILVVTIYISNQFNNITIEQLLFHMNTKLEGGSKGVILTGIKTCFFPVLGITIILALPIFMKIFHTSTIIEVSFKNKVYRHSLKKPILLYALGVFFLSILYSFYVFDVQTYVKNITTDSKLIFNEYIDPRSVKITFPKKKRNLIYIFLESMETTYMDMAAGGGFQRSLIPELENLAKENLNFSNTTKLGGAVQLPATHFTIAGMVAQTAGLPLKNNYLVNKQFLPNAVTLTDLLAKEHYNQLFLLGSPAKFGDRDLYFKTHGNVEIVDYLEAKKKHYIASDYLVWWGYEDKKLFSNAKKELTNLAIKKEPFHFMLLTADTHFTDGYLDSSCPKKFDTQYENVFACSSMMVKELIDWIQKQDFYENTTIVLTGDHLGMQADFYKKLDPNFQRTTFNTFINSKIKTTNNQNRLFSTFDLFPTILASLDVKIEGNRLGLGTNLFSNEKTLLEKYSYEYVEHELKKNSQFYSTYFQNKK